jgi:hypothetical protein
VEILVSEEDDVLVCYSTDIMNNHDKAIWKLQFLDLFPYGRGGFDEHHKTWLSLKSYMANALWLSSRHFALHHAFPLIAFDVLAYNHAATSIYVRCKVNLINAAHAAIITKENLRIQLEYQESRHKSLLQGLLPPSKPPLTNGHVFLNKVEFGQDSPTIGGPMKSNNKPTHVYFHILRLLANHPIFSLLHQIVLAYGVSPIMQRGS